MAPPKETPGRMHRTMVTGRRYGNAIKKTCAVLAAGLIGFGPGVALGQTGNPPLEELLQGSETILGQAIAYPEGKPVVTAAIVTMTPGQESGWHTHEAPLFVWMLAGELTVDYGSDGARVYRTGDSLLDAFRSRHNGRNSGTEDVRLLAVFMGAEGVANTVMTPEPE